MSRLMVFNSLSLDGYFTDKSGDMSWAHKNDAEWNSFVADNAKGECVMVFGRITYEMMASWWPTPQAMKSIPVVADRMNRAPKVVFSRTLEQAQWNKRKMVKTDWAAAIRKMKQKSGPDTLVIGSGTIVSQLAQKGLIDEYQ